MSHGTRSPKWILDLPPVMRSPAYEAWIGLKHWHMSGTEYGYSDPDERGIIGQISLGCLFEMQEVFGLVVSALEELADA
jgi:hypothetical protein